jgi:hypothetical protein
MKLLVLTVATVILSACAGLPAINAGLDPSDPAAPVPSVDNTSVMAGTAEYGPVEPKPWIEQNQRVAPKPRSAQ